MTNTKVVNNINNNIPENNVENNQTVENTYNKENEKVKHQLTFGNTLLTTNNKETCNAFSKPSEDLK
jgi:hypothetical protein